MKEIFHIQAFQKNCKRKKLVEQSKRRCSASFLYQKRECALLSFFKVSATMAVQITPYYNNTHVSHGFDML